MCDPELKSFIINEVQQPLGNISQTLGSGSYGSVEMLVVGEYRLKCAGKSLHKILVDAGNQGAENIRSKFIRECKLMSSLHHPNIVQFLGICFLQDSYLPVLLMEYMTFNLESLLEASQVVLMSAKVSILHDVAQGLAYLHCHSPAVIHRDLTASNILLNSALSAKISDFGNSRLIDISPTQLAKTMTSAPGTLAYLPPETINPKPKYNTKVDCFSYGHLALYTMIQVFPMPSAPTFLDPETKNVIGRSEVERREDFIQSMTNDNIDSLMIKKLVTDCLRNDPAKRPSSLQILGVLQQLKGSMRDPDAALFLHEGGAQKDSSKIQLKSPSVSTILFEVRSCFKYISLIEFMHCLDCSFTN